MSVERFYGYKTDNMTAYETFIDNYNKHADDSVLKQDISSALLDLCTTDEQIKILFTSFAYARFIDEPTLRKCIDLYTENKKLLQNMYNISEFVKIHSSVIADNMNDFIIEYIISEDGYKRMLGRQLWDNLDMEHSEIDILSYNEEVQGRFALSILQDMMFPQRRLPKVLPLFNSPFQNVRKILTVSLSNYTFNYFGTAKKTFEEGVFNETDELTLFKEFLNQCDVRFDMYHNCKELRSIYALPDEYEIAQRQVSEHMREQTRNSREEHEPSFLKLFNQVMLGRGGGFRDDNGRVQPLGHFKFSQEMPMMLHGMSPLEIIEYNNNVLFKNWHECVKKDEIQNS